MQALNVSFTDVLRGGAWLDDIGPQDLIYSVGLIDYLIDRRARALATRLYERLAPGGLLIIGNMNETELSNLWPMEFITDWHLFYRTEADMMAWTEGMAGARVDGDRPDGPRAAALRAQVAAFCLLLEGAR